MKKIVICISSVLISATLSAQNPQLVPDEKDIIMKTVQTAYVEGLQNEGDTVKINSGFHPGFEMLIPAENGELKKYPISKWKEKIKADLASGKLPRKTGETVSVKFLDVDVTGNAAMAKFEFYVGGKLTYIDYQFLYKFSDGWKIVSKIYHKL